MNETLPIAVIVGVVSGFITTISTVFINKSKDKLQYITSERAKWREEIREIANKLQIEENIFKIENILCELEVRINPYGIMDKDNIFKDGHIWKIIEVLKKCKDYDRRKENKEVLIKYLSCLLKYDWERSKIEILGSKSLTLYIILSIIFPITMYGNYYLEKNELNIDIKVFCLMALIIVIMSILNLICIILQKKYLSSYFIENRKKNNIEKNTVKNNKWEEFFKTRNEIWICLKILLFTTILVIIMINNINVCIGFIGIILIYAILFAGIVWYDVEIEVSNYTNYYNIIEEISPKIESDNFQINEESQKTSSE